MTSMNQVSNQKSAVESLSLETQTYPIQSPLNTSSARKQLLEIFPNYLDPDCPTERQRTCQKSIEELQAFLKEHQEQAEVIDFVKDKLKIAIFSNPYPESAKIFSDFFASQFTEELVEPEVSDFFSISKVPSIIELGTNLFSEESLEDDSEIQTQSKSNNTYKLSYPIIMNSASNQDLKDTIVDIFNTNNGRIPNFERLLCWFPDYLVKYHALTTTLFFGTGPIPIDQRYYIAILATSNFGCEYLHSRLSQAFIDVGGNIEWLQNGLEAAGTKMQALAGFASKMAYQPHEIMKNAKTLNDLKENGWGKSELIHASFIIAFFHNFASACLALGVRNELDVYNSHNPTLSKPQTPAGSNQQSPKGGVSKRSSIDQFSNKEIEKLLKSMTNMLSDSMNEIEQQKQEEDTSTTIPQQTTQQQQQQQSINQDQSSYQDICLPPSDPFTSNVENPLNTSMSKTESQQTAILLEKFKKFTTNFNFNEDRAPQTLRYSDFNFNAHGYQVSNQYASDLARDSLDILDVIKHMTNMNLNETKGLSTKPFRKAIELYVQNIFGYTRYDADYKKEMNALLPIPLKKLLKLSVKTPFSVRSTHINGVNLELMPSEIAHIVLISVHARIEVELTYFLNPFQKF